MFNRFQNRWASKFEFMTHLFYRLDPLDFKAKNDCLEGYYACFIILRLLVTLFRSVGGIIETAHIVAIPHACMSHFFPL